MSIPSLIIDTREQTPWRFSASVLVTKAKLKSGDYSIAGLEDLVAIERKTREDLVNTLVHGRKRFFDELHRMRDYRYAAVYVESDLGALISGDYFSGMNPRALVGSMAAVMADFGIPLIFCGNRANAALVAEITLTRLSETVTR